MRKTLTLASQPRHTTTFLLLLPLFVSSFARAQRLPLKTYTVSDGLANDQINAIVPDSRGFLWFCTGEGLSRFDGYTFFNFGTAQGLPHPNVTDLLVTRGGEYWVATDGGLARFNPRGAATGRTVYTNEATTTPPPMFTVIVPEGEGRRATAITVEPHPNRHSERSRTQSFERGECGCPPAPLIYRECLTPIDSVDERHCVGHQSQA